MYLSGARIERVQGHIGHICYSKSAAAIQWIKKIFSISDVRFIGYLNRSKLSHTIHKKLFVMNHRQIKTIK